MQMNFNSAFVLDNIPLFISCNIERGDSLRIERIGTNQIRCTLTSIDLGNRNLNIAELAYGSEKTKALFQEMITKASYEVGFDVDDSPIMVEAVPMLNEGIVIYITKVDDPEELDTRFARLSPQIEDMVNAFDLKINHLLEGALELNILSNGNNLEFKDFSETNYIRAYSFNSLDEFIKAAKAVGNYPGENILYKDEVKNRFILVLKNDEKHKKEFAAAANILSEYGIKLPATSFSENYYREHFKVLIKKDAISSVAKI